MGHGLRVGGAFVCWMSVLCTLDGAEIEPFSKGSQHVGFILQAGPGHATLGSIEAHDLALMAVNYGGVLLEAGDARWWQGSCELMLEVFGGAQLNPENAYLAGALPILRYNFTSGKRLVPFLDIGAGVSATDIGEPDLGGRFQFNLQGGGGGHLFVAERLALTLQYRFIHLSNAGIKGPNGGANTSLFGAGLTWFF